MFRRIVQTQAKSLSGCALPCQYVVRQSCRSSRGCWPSHSWSWRCWCPRYWDRQAGDSCLQPNIARRRFDYCSLWLSSTGDNLTGLKRARWENSLKSEGHWKCSEERWRNLRQNVRSIIYPPSIQLRLTGSRRCRPSDTCHGNGGQNLGCSDRPATRNGRSACSYLGSNNYFKKIRPSIYEIEFTRPW